MSWRDREYTQADYHDGAPSPIGGSGIRRPPNGTLGLMIAHGALFFLMVALQHDESGILAMLQLQGAAPHPLGILLHPVSTNSLFTIIFVELVLYSLSARIELTLGLIRLIVLYAAAGLAGGLAYFGVVLAAPHLGGAELDYPVGFLAGLCYLGYRWQRNEPVSVLGWMTTAGKMYLIFAGIVAGLVVLRTGVGSVAWLATAAVGVGVGVLIERGGKVAWRSSRRRRPVVRPSIPPARRDEPDYVPDVDDVLDKISREGIDALTPEDRKRLEDARKSRGQS